ncbi:hypothetical protein V8C43DRAFT_282585 [Trichoderma afarasin]
MQGRQRCHDVVPSYKGAICLRQTKSLQPLKTLPVPETRSQIKINSTTCCLFLLHNSHHESSHRARGGSPSAPLLRALFSPRNITMQAVVMALKLPVPFV